MIMNLIAWIILGGIAGWLASLIMNTDAEQGPVANIVVGIIGAFIGGFVVQWLTGTAVGGFNLMTLLTAVLGAVILLAVLKLFHHGASSTV
jgi:uncharacterized membrane protein YeaQ/YmgE (transglycosylase-associated protein family)